MSQQQELTERIGRLSPRRQALLLARLNGEQGGAKRGRQLSLAAFVTPSAEQVPGADQFRESLRQLLPEYMIPASFTVLDEFPLLPNGKVDMAALSVEKKTSRTSPPAHAAERDFERKLTDIWCKVLQTDFIGIEDDFFEMGGDSILSIQVVSLAHQGGLALTANDLFEYPTIAQLAAQLRGREMEADHTPVSYPDSGQAPLTPIQHRFLNQALELPAHWNQNLLLEIEAVLSADVLEVAIGEVTRQHDALKTCFPCDGGSCYQQVDEQLSPDFRVTGISADDDIDAVISSNASAIQTGFSLDSAPLVSFMLFECAGERPDRLLICAHQLVIDGVSWRILVEDLEQACTFASRGETMVLPAHTASYLHWSRSLEQTARSSEILSELDYWKSLPLAETSSIPCDRDGIHPCEGNVESLTVMLDENDTAALTGTVHAAYRTTVLDLLLTALAQVLCRWTGRVKNSIWLESNDRELLAEGMDSSRSIGCFTVFYPVCLEVSKQHTSAADIKHTKGLLYCIPNRGGNYGLLRYLYDDSETRSVLNAMPEPQVSFNYTGNINEINAISTLFRDLHVDCEPQRAPANRRAHLLDISCRISAGRLVMSWTHDQDIHDRETIALLANDYLDLLHGLISHCLDPSSGGYTPSDFPDAGLDQDDLDAFIDRLS